jgi:hypothetical protein
MTLSLPNSESVSVCHSRCRPQKEQQYRRRGGHRRPRTIEGPDRSFPGRKWLVGTSPFFIGARPLSAFGIFQEVFDLGKYLFPVAELVPKPFSWFWIRNRSLFRSMTFSKILMMLSLCAKINVHIINKLLICF